MQECRQKLYEEKKNAEPHSPQTRSSQAEAGRVTTVSKLDERKDCRAMVVVEYHVQCSCLPPPPPPLKTLLSHFFFFLFVIFHHPMRATTVITCDCGNISLQVLYFMHSSYSPVNASKKTLEAGLPEKMKHLVNYFLH